MEFKISEEKTKINENILILVNKETNEKIYINSKYNAKKDMETFLNTFEIKNDSIIVLFGIESGIMLDILNEREFNGHVICYEPIAELLEIYKKKDKKIKFKYSGMTVLEKNEESLYIEMKNFFMNTINNVDIKNIVFIIQKKYRELFPKECGIFIDSLKKTIIAKNIELNTFDYFSSIYMKNYFSNLKSMNSSYPVLALKEKLKDKPAVIVSAGPSLEKNIKNLIGKEENVVIITGGRTLTTLLKFGIKPHLVVSVDPGEDNYNLFKNIMNSKVPLVTEWLNNYNIVNEYKGKKIFYNGIKIDNLDKDLFGKEIGMLEQGGSVATVQLSLATFMGCNPITFIGQDLAYTDNKYHADSASHKDSKKNEVKIQKDHHIQVKGNLEKSVYTNHSLNVFKEWIESFIFTRQGFKIYNSTEGGAYINGTEWIELEKFIEKFGVEPKNFTYEIDNCLNSTIISKENKIVFNENLDKIKKSIEKTIELSQEALFLLKKIKILISKNRDTSLVLNRLTQIDKEIEKNEKNTSIVSYYIQKELVLFQCFEMEGKNDKEVIKINESLYKTINKSYKDVLEIMNTFLGGNCNE